MKARLASGPPPGSFRRWLVCCGLALLCLPVWHGVQWCKGMDRARPAPPRPDPACFLPVTARVLAQLPDDGREFTRSDDATVNSFIIRYSYTVDGRTYVGDRYSFAQRAYAVAGDYGQSFSAQNQYVPGREITVYHHREHPAEAVIVREFGSSLLVATPWSEPSAVWWDMFFWLTVLAAVISIPGIWGRLEKLVGRW